MRARVHTASMLFFVSCTGDDGRAIKLNTYALVVIDDMELRRADERSRHGYTHVPMCDINVIFIVGPRN